MKSKGMKVTAIVIATLFLAILALPHLVDVDRFRPQLESKLASALGRDVHVGHMEFSFLAGGARVDQITVADDPAFSDGNFLQAKSLGVGVSFLSLIFSHSLHVTSLTLDEPRLTAIKSAKGEWNFASLGGAHQDNEQEAPSSMTLVSPATSVVLDRLKISNAMIEMVSGDRTGQPATLKNVNLDLKNVSYAGAMSFVLSAKTDTGKLEIEGEAGPVNRDNPEQTPFHATIKASKADLAEIASLGSSSGLAGILNLSGTVTSDGSTVHSEGKASAEKLRLVRGGKPASQTLSLHYATDYAVDEKKGTIHDGKILIGKSAATLSGTYEAEGKNLNVHMKISGSHLPLDNIAGVLGALGVTLPGGSKLHGGAVDGNLSLDGPVDRLVTAGSAQITNAHLAGFNLGSKMSALPGMSGLKGSSDLSIVNLSTHLRIGPEGTHISDFKCELAGIGNLTGDGDVSANDHLQFKMAAHVAGDGAVRFGLNHVGLRNVPNDIPFRVVGTTSMPVIIPDMTSMAKKTGTAAAKEVAKNAGASMMKKITGQDTKTASAAPQASNNQKKGGFFHSLFHRKDKHGKEQNPELAAQRTKF